MRYRWEIIIIIGNETIFWIYIAYIWSRLARSAMGPVGGNVVTFFGYCVYWLADGLTFVLTCCFDSKVPLIFWLFYFRGARNVGLLQKTIVSNLIPKKCTTIMKTKKNSINNWNYKDHNADSFWILKWL